MVNKHPLSLVDIHVTMVKISSKVGCLKVFITVVVGFIADAITLN